MVIEVMATEAKNKSTIFDVKNIWQINKTIN